MSIIAKFAAESLSWYRGSAPLCDINFLKSINKKIINEAKENINFNDFGEIAEKEYYNLNYDLRPYVYLSRKLSNNYSKNIKEKIKKVKEKIKKVKEKINFNWTDDENENDSYIKNLLKSSDKAKVKNSIYALVLLISQHEKNIKQLVSLGLGLLLGNTSTSFDTPAINKELLKITKKLREYKIIDDTMSVNLKKKKIIFSKEKRNITRDIFKKISDGQSNLMSYVFFLEITLNKNNKIILDDPFDTLDHGNSYRVLSTIKKYEKKKKIIVLTHKVSSMEMMKLYLNEEWRIQYLKNKISFQMSDLNDLERKLFYLYKNNCSDKSYENDGFLLILRYLRDDPKIDALIYNDINNKKFKVDFLEKYYFKNKKEIKTELEFYNLLLECYNKLLNIKKYIKNKYKDKDWKKIKEQIKSGVLETKDIILKKYSKLFFVINDLSHNNSWGFHLLDILSFENDLLDLNNKI